MRLGAVSGSGCDTAVRMGGSISGVRPPWREPRLRGIGIPPDVGCDIGVVGAGLNSAAPVAAGPSSGPDRRDSTARRLSRIISQSRGDLRLFACLRPDAFAWRLRAGQTARVARD